MSTDLGHHAKGQGLGAEKGTETGDPDLGTEMTRTEEEIIAKSQGKRVLKWKCLMIQNQER